MKVIGEAKDGQLIVMMMKGEYQLAEKNRGGFEGLDPAQVNEIIERLNVSIKKEEMAYRSSASPTEYGRWQGLKVALSVIEFVMKRKPK